MHSFPNLLTYEMLLPSTIRRFLDFILPHLSKTSKWTVGISFEAFMTLTMQVVVLWVTTLQSGEHNASAKW